MGLNAHHPTERARLQAVRALGLIGTQPDLELADIVCFAAELLHAPTALISLMDEERQVFVARQGFAGLEAPRGVTFCDHVVSRSSPLVVLDAHKDVRFVDNPFVTGAPYVRFYAGEPLLSDDGFCLGVLCIGDTQPRAAFPPAQQATLQRLARFAAQSLRARAVRRGRDDARASHAESERLLLGILDEASEAISACDRLAAFIHRRLTPSLSRANEHLSNIADANASVELRHARMLAVSEIVASRELAEDMWTIARFDAQLARGHARAYQPSVVLRDVVRDLTLTAAGRGVTLALDDRTAGYETVGDELLLEELLDQLLSDIVAQIQDTRLRLACRFESSIVNRSVLVFAVAVEPDWALTEHAWEFSDYCRDLVGAMGGAWDTSDDEHGVKICLPARLRMPVRSRVDTPSNVVSFTQVQLEQQ